MKLLSKYIFSALFLAASGGSATAQSMRANTYCNPLNVDYTYMIYNSSNNLSYRSGADPAVVEFRGEYYMFVTRSHGYWHSKDLLNWDFITPGKNWYPQGSNAPAAHNYKDSVLYVMGDPSGSMSVLYTDDPKSGNWNATPAILHDLQDPDLFIDDDGQAYLFWGQANAKGAKLSKDMLSIEGEVHEKLLTYKEHAFNEGSSVRKRNGIYYYVYAGHQRHGESNCATLNYATATFPLGPYTYRGVIIDNWGSDRNLVNNHGSIAEIDGQWYIFYHRPTHASSSMRKVCMEPIVFNPDGTINEVEMTTQGCGGPINPLLRMDAARACLLSGHTTVVVRRPAHSNPVEYLSAIRNGDCAYWKYFDFTGMEVNSFICKTWGKNAAGTIEIRLDKPDGELIGTCELQPMNGDVAYSVHRTKVKPVTGVHALVLVFKNNDPSMTGQDFMNLEWFMFENHDR